MSAASIRVRDHERSRHSDEDHLPNAPRHFDHEGRRRVLDPVRKADLPTLRSRHRPPDRDGDRAGRAHTRRVRLHATVEAPRSAHDIEQAPHCLRTAMGRTARDLRDTGFEWEHVSVVEISPRGDRHLHFLQHGSAVSSKQLREALAKHGVGWSELATIRRPPVIARYILKVPIGALDLHTEQAVEVLEMHKARNGGRLATTTSGFWRAPGRPEIDGARAARAVAYRRWRASRSVLTTSYGSHLDGNHAGEQRAGRQRTCGGT